VLNIKVSFDSFHNRMLVAGLKRFKTLSDPAVDRLWLRIDKRFGFLPPKDFFYTVIGDLARRNSFHPVLDYLNGLKWDGVARINKWLVTYGKAPDTPYVNAISAIVLIAAVRRVRQPGCKFDEMLVLESPQGKDKSTMLATLARNPDWFSDDLPLGIGGKQTIEHLAGRWIVEAGELKGMRRAEVESLKSFLSRQVDRARLSYDRMVTEQPRQCIIIGTTNHSEYLRDLTGNRRYWPVRVEEFDIEALKRDVDQLWAEAAAREAKGESIRLDAALWQEAAVEQQARTLEDPWVATLADVLGDLQGKLLVSDAWEIVGVNRGHQTQDQNSRLGNAMRELGWVRDRRRFKAKSGKPYCYVRGQGELAEIRVSDEGKRATVDDDDLK
jgi:predicted P-loop ATPase